MDHMSKSFERANEVSEWGERKSIVPCSRGGIYAKDGAVHAPRPMPLEGPIKEDVVQEHRNLYCLSYDRCLDACVQQGWPGWTCRMCTYRCAGTPPEVGVFAEARPRNPILG